jgi:hypothetical protein
VLRSPTSISGLNHQQTSAMVYSCVRPRDPDLTTMEIHVLSRPVWTKGLPAQQNGGAAPNVS